MQGVFKTTMIIPMDDHIKMKKLSKEMDVSQATLHRMAITEFLKTMKVEDK